MAAFAYSLLRTGEPVVQVQMGPVLVANNNIERWEPLTATNTKVEHWPRSNHSARAFTNQASAKGQVSASSLARGRPITKTDAGFVKQLFSTSSELSPPLHRIAIELEQLEDFSGGVISRGDKVDLFYRKGEKRIDIAVRAVVSDGLESRPPFRHYIAVELTDSQALAYFQANEKYDVEMTYSNMYQNEEQKENPDDD